MNWFKSLMDWAQRMQSKAQETKMEKQAMALDVLSRETINVIEFNGRLYIAYNGAPVVRLEDLTGDPVKILTSARIDYLVWKNKFNH